MGPKGDISTLPLHFHLPSRLFFELMLEWAFYIIGFLMIRQSPLTLTRAANHIQRVYRMYRSYQMILEKERKTRGAFINDAVDDLNRILPGFFAYFLKIRLVGYHDSAELGLSDTDLSPSYERLANPHRIKLLRDAVAFSEKNCQLINSSNNASNKIELFHKAKVEFIHTPKFDSILNIVATQKGAYSYGALDLFPSLYQMVRLLYPLQSRAPESFPDVVCQHIRDHSAFKKISTRQSVHLIYQFVLDACFHLPMVKQDRFINEIMNKMIQAMEWMALYDNLQRHYPRVMQLYIYMMGLVRVAVCYQAPYSLNDYTAALDSIQLERLGLSDVRMHHYPVKSGMDALLTAFTAEKKQSKNSHVIVSSLTDPIHNCPDFKHVYFEANILFHQFTTSASASLAQDDISPEIYILGLTSEHQLNDFEQADNFIENLASIKASCAQLKPNQYVTLIIDQTISVKKESDPAVRFVSQLSDEVKQGQLNICLCKSFQKYASLGTSGIKLGNITMLNNADNKFQAVKQYLDETREDNVRDSFDEIQIATFFLKHFPQNEYHFIEKASQNAKLFKEKFYKKNPHVFVSGPFIHAHGGAVEFNFPVVVNFGFLNTTKVAWVSRINIGLDVTSPKLDTPRGSSRNKTKQHRFFMPESVFHQRKLFLIGKKLLLKERKLLLEEREPKPIKEFKKTSSHQFFQPEPELHRSCLSLEEREFSLNQREFSLNQREALLQHGRDSPVNILESRNASYTVSPDIKDLLPPPSQLMERFRL